MEQPKYEGGVDFNNGKVLEDPNDPIVKTKNEIARLTDNIKELEDKKKSLVELVTKIELDISKNPEMESGTTKKILEENRQNILALNNQIRISGEDLAEHNAILGKKRDEQYAAGGVLNADLLNKMVSGGR